MFTPRDLKRVGLVVLFLALAGLTDAAADPIQWKEEKGEHFIVFYQNNESFARDVRSSADGYYAKIASDLGYERYSDFWQWDNRVKIYVYASDQEFHNATGQPVWSKGVARYDTKEIMTFALSQGFLDSLLPHEITHLVFRDFVGFKGQVPLWLDEGVAQWEEPQKRAIARQVARYLVNQHRAYPLTQLTSMDIRGSLDDNTVHYFYMQSVCLVDFLVTRYGAQSFTEFCRALRDGKQLEEALKSAYPDSIGSLQDLENQWEKYVVE